MKIDFIGKGMAIRFDKVPKLIYFNENSEGSGGVILSGKSIKNLVSTDIRAETNTEYRHPLEYNITFYNPSHHQEESIATGKSLSDKDDGLKVSVRITDLESFKSALEDIKQIAIDERIPEKIRKEYASNFLKAIKGKPVSKS